MLRRRHKEGVGGNYCGGRESRGLESLRRPPNSPPEAEERPALTDGERHAQRSVAHRKAVTAVPKDGGEPLRFDSALSAAEWLCQNGRTTSITAARLLICDVIHSRRKSAFGYIWNLAPPPSADDFHP